MNRAQLIPELQRIVGSTGVVDDPHALMVYNSDGCVMDTHNPDVVVIPTSAEQVAAIVKLARDANLPIIPRGAGTGLSGGATPIQGGIVVSFARMEQILEIDPPNRRAFVQPGIINFELSEQLKPYRYHFAPDPSSQKTCTIGGNIANNSGGPHCLKYGVTSNHILALEIVLHDGTTVWTGEGLFDAAGYDLTGLIVGSEGTFCLTTRAMVRMTRLPEANRVVLALFPSIASATEVVSAVVAAGYLPTSLEMMDNNVIRAVNKGYQLGLPEDAGAALIIEVDGVEDGLDDLLQQIISICNEHGAVEIRPAKTAEEQTRVWSARKNAFGAIGRLAPGYYLADTVVPRTKLPFMMDEVSRLSKTYGLEIANVFHAGDGNLHPIVLYNPRNPDEVERALRITGEVIHISIEQGGVLSGEHGIGIEKQKYMAHFYQQAELETMAAVYPVFNPDNTLNPGKIFPPGTDPLQLAQQRHQRITAPQGGMSLSELPDELEGIVGSKHILSPEDTDAYVIDGLKPRMVVFPANVEQLSDVMAACNQAGAVVVPWGGGTRQSAGYLSMAPDVVIVMRRLNSVLKYEPDDLTIGIGAGATLAELQTLLAQHGQMFPIDAPQPEQTTLGGMVATAADGPRRLGYGILRDLLLGLTIVEADGTVVRVGGQVVKNVSGYDLVKLFLGSYGTLGIIASVNLKTLPAPLSEASLLVTFPQQQNALDMLKELEESPLIPTAAEYLNQGALQRIGHVGACALAIRAEGMEVACQRHIRDLQAMAVPHNLVEARELTGDDHTALWREISNLSASDGGHLDEALLRIVTLPSELGKALVQLEKRAIARGLICICNARALNGVMYLRLRGAANDIGMFQHEILRDWQHSHVLAWQPAWKSDIALWGEPPLTIGLMRAIKQAFDPANKLNPGRYIV